MRALSAAADERAAASLEAAFALELELEQLYGVAADRPVNLRQVVAELRAERAPRRISPGHPAPANPTSEENSGVTACEGGGPRSAQASLESIGISDPVAGASATFLGDENPYMRDVEAETAGYRIARAKRLRDRAVSIIALTPPPELPEALAEGVPALPPPPAPYPYADEDPPQAWLDWKEALKRRAHWHLSRAKGSLERFPRVRDCGDAKIVATCTRGCGVERTSPAHCAVGRLCVKCRARSATKRKERFNFAREIVIAELRHKGMLAGERYGRTPRGGKWGEKFFTLTVPHVEVNAIEGARQACESKGIGASSQSVAARVALLIEAWRYFSHRLQKWARGVHLDVGKRARIAWYRAFEWTPSEGLGHPHFHLWLVAPYLPQPMVVGWWRAALRRAGLPWEGDLIVDIRPWKMRGEDRANELIKGARALHLETTVQYIEGWQIVDQVDGKRVPPEVSARLYESLEGHRLVQTSKGLLEPVLHMCPFCEGDGTVDVRILRPSAAELAKLEGTQRAPPSSAPS